MIRTLINIISLNNFYREYSDTLLQVGEFIIKDSVAGMEDTNIDIRTISALSLKSYVEALCTLIVRLQENKATQTLVSIFSQEQGILTLLSHILLSPVVSEPSLILFPKPKDTAEEAVNDTKAEILEMLKSLVNHIFTRCPPQTKPSTLGYFKTLSSIISTAVEQIQTVYIYSKCPISKFPETSQRVLLAILNLISKSSNIIDFYSIYSETARRLMTTVLLPELMVTEREIEDFDYNEVEFVNFSMDVCSDQNSKVAKTLSMRILKNFCEKIDGLLTFTAVGMMALADTILAQRSEEDSLKEFPVVQPIIQSEFVKGNKTEKILDVCLLVITAIENMLSNRPDLM